MDAPLNDYAELEAAMQLLQKSTRRPQHWAHISAIAGTEIDRPGAIMLLAITRGKKKRVIDVAEILGVEPPSITRKAQELERLGLLERVPDTKDKRSVTLQATDDGQVIADKLWAAKQVFIQNVLSEWPEVDRQQFVQLFTKFANGVTQSTDKHI